MFIVDNVPFAAQYNIYEAFHNENGYVIADEVAGWLQAQGTNILAMQGVPTSSNTVFVFGTEEDYTAFLLKWA